MSSLDHIGIILNLTICVRILHQHSKDTLTGKIKAPAIEGHREKSMKRRKEEGEGVGEGERYKGFLIHCIRMLDSQLSGGKMTWLRSL